VKDSKRYLGVSNISVFALRARGVASSGDEYLLCSSLTCGQEHCSDEVTGFHIGETFADKKRKGQRKVPLYLIRCHCNIVGLKSLLF
jgi:hypothetical protein